MRIVLAYFCYPEDIGWIIKFHRNEFNFRRGQCNRGSCRSSGWWCRAGKRWEAEWPRLCNRIRLFVLTCGTSAAYIGQTREGCSSVRIVFLTFKVQGTSTRIDVSVSKVDTAMGEYNHCWLLLLPWQLRDEERWHSGRGGHANIQLSSDVCRTEVLVIPTCYFAEVERSCLLCLTAFSSVVWLRDTEFSCQKCSSLWGFWTSMSFWYLCDLIT